MKIKENSSKNPKKHMQKNSLMAANSVHTHLDWVAQHTALQDFEMLSGLVVLIKSTTISVIVVPIATGSLF